MKITEQIFKPYDIRGKFPEQFNSETILNLGRVIGNYFGLDKNIVIGGDVRLSSPIIRSVLSAGLMEAGCNVLDVGLCTTPTIYFLAARNPEIDGGLMVTASHNPIDYNGIKVCDENGVSFHYDNMFSKVKEILGKGTISTVKIKDYGQQADFSHISTSQYWQFQKESFNPKKPLNVIVDIGNGSCYPIVKILESRNLNAIALHSEPNGNFPFMIPDPAKSASLRFIQDEMKNRDFDVGIGFDSDGDRVGFIDDLGKIISPDQIIMLFGEYLLQKKPKARIMIDIKTSRATYEYLTNLEAEVKFTRVGHSWIHETLLETRAIFAGELSGHYYFGFEYYGFDDAIFSALRLLEILSLKDQTLSTLIQKLPRYFASEEIRIPCADEFKQKIIFNIKDILTNEAEKTITIDGIRAEFKDGWVLVRKSGTEPVISVRAEAVHPQRLKYYQEYIVDLVTTEIDKFTKISRSEKFS
ncbi:MAG: phosphomannomutase/phosphoglucomutase [Candidatus Hodarchaeota archaeon]